MKVKAKRTIRYPIALERGYAKELVAHTKRLMDVVRSYVPKMKSVIASEMISFDRNDDTDNAISQLMKEMTAEVESLPSMQSTVEKTYEAVRKRTHDELAAVFISLFGTQPYAEGISFRRDDDLQDRMREEAQFEKLKKIWVMENLDLIKSIDAETLRKVQDAMSNAVIGTVDRAELTKTLNDEIEKIAGSEKNRAALIGRDQVGKLHGRMDEYEQRQLGIEEFIWVTAGDERVRPSHQSLSGHKFSWKNPPSEGRPGQPIQCRCIADPVIDLKRINLAPKPGSYEIVDGSDSLRELMGNIPRKDVTPEVEAFLRKYVSNDNLIFDPTMKEIPMTNFPDFGIVVVNLQHPNIGRYKLAEAVTHEFVHWLDFREGVSAANAVRIGTAVQKASQYILSHEAKFQKHMDSSLGRNMCVSDLFSAITNGKVHGDFGHREDYWEQTGKQEYEVLANITALVYTRNKECLRFLAGIPGLKELIKELPNEFSRVAGMGA